MARPTPSTTEAAMPLFAAGTDTRKYVSIGVAPRAREASSYSCGTACNAVMDTLMMEGSIMTARTRMAASRLAPSGTSKKVRMPGTRTSMPTRPYTTDGMPARRLTADSMMERTRGDAIFASHTAVKKPTGTPRAMAPAVPQMLVRMKGRMPNRGSEAVEAHVSPKRKSTSPISRMAGRPEKTR